MNEMLRGLGFGQVTNTTWTNGSTMRVIINCTNLNLTCQGYIKGSDGMISSVFSDIKATDLETMKRHIEKFMRMVGKCIQVDEE